MKNCVRTVLCVDDTDDVTKATSTGAVAEAIAGCIAELGGVLELEISRHQLLLDERVPYTSHNSSMALSARVPTDQLGDLRYVARQVIHSMMADGADPGLCIACVPYDEDDPLLYELVAFGRRAKEDYISKAEAYRLAERIGWLTLEELGGDGQGVVGALAGVGLRLSGSDGRFRGKWDLKAVCEGAGNVRSGRSGGNGSGGGHGRGHGDGSGGGHGRGDGSGGGRGRHRNGNESQNVSLAHSPVAIPAGLECAVAYPARRVREALEAQVAGRVLVVDSSGSHLPDSTLVCADDKVKPVLYAGCFTIVCELDVEGIAHPCTKDDLNAASSRFADMDRSCPAFEFDNDLEEFGAVESVSACPNCLYRRWTSGGFTCMKRAVPVRSFSEVIA